MYHYRLTHDYQCHFCGRVCVLVLAAENPHNGFGEPHIIGICQACVDACRSAFNQHELDQAKTTTEATPDTDITLTPYQQKVITDALCKLTVDQGYPLRELPGYRRTLVEEYLALNAKVGPTVGA